MAFDPSAAQLAPDDAPMSSGDDEGRRKQTAFERNRGWTRPGPRQFTTSLQPDEEAKFQAWVKASKAPFDPGQQADFDMRGFWKTSQDPAEWKRLQQAGKIPADMEPAGTKIDPNDGKPHFPDYWKTPYHETFSNESQWATEKAPKWNEKDQLVTPDGKVLFDDKAQNKPAEPAKSKFDQSTATLWEPEAKDQPKQASGVEPSTARPFMERVGDAARAGGKAIVSGLSAVGSFPVEAGKKLIERQAEDFRTGYADKPGYSYGQVLPFRMNDQTGEVEWGYSPESARMLLRAAQMDPMKFDINDPAQREQLTAVAGALAGLHRAPGGLNLGARPPGASPRTEPGFPEPPAGPVPRLTGPEAPPGEPPPGAPLQIAGPGEPAPLVPGEPPAAPTPTGGLPEAKAKIQQGVTLAQRYADEIQQLRTQGATPEMLAPAIQRNREHLQQLQSYAEQVRDMERTAAPTAAAAPTAEPDWYRSYLDGIRSLVPADANPWAPVAEAPADQPHAETPIAAPAPTEAAPAAAPATEAPAPVSPTADQPPSVGTFQDMRTAGYDKNPDHPLAGRIEHLKELAQSPNLLPREQRELERRVRHFEQFNQLVADLPVEQRAMARSLRPDDIIQGKDKDGRTIVGRVEGFDRTGIMSVQDANGLDHQVHVSTLEDVQHVARGGQPIPVVPPSDQKRDEVPSPEAPSPESTPKGEATTVPPSPPTETAYGGPWTRVKTKDGEDASNRQGEPLYENPNGARATFDNGVPHTESVIEHPEKGLVPRNVVDRRGQFLTAEETGLGAAPPKPKSESLPKTGGEAGKSKPKTAEKPDTESGGSSEWKYLYDNEEGDPIYTNDQGVHSIVKDGVRIVEKVRLRPTKAGMAMSVPPPMEKEPAFRPALAPKPESESVEPPKSISTESLPAEAQTPITKVLASSADQITPKDMVLANLDQGGEISGVIAPDGRLYVFHEGRGGRYNYEVSHKNFREDFPDHDYAEVTVYNGNHVGIRATQAYTPAQIRTINGIRSHAGRHGGDTRVSYWDGGKEKSLEPEAHTDSKLEPLAPEHETWWNKNLTPYGRRLVMNKASVNLPDQVLWHHVSYDNKVKLLQHRDAAIENVAPPASTPAEKPSTEAPKPVEPKTATVADMPKPPTADLKGIPKTAYRGTGRADVASAYNGVAEPIAGTGRYSAFSKTDAEKFGPNVEEAPIDLKNPLVIRSDDQWRALTKEAGWEFPNPSFGMTADKMKAAAAKLKEVVQGKGHDGIIAWWNNDTPYDVDDQNRSIKTLRNALGVPQVIDYREPEAAKPFDPVEFDRVRDERVAASRAAGNTHLDILPMGVETMRGKIIEYVHGPEERGVVTTVTNRGQIYVRWQGGPHAGQESFITDRDAKDFVVVDQMSPEQAVSKDPFKKTRPKPTEHPGLRIKSLETGEETVIQPIGTVPPKVLAPEKQKEKYDALNPADTAAATGEPSPTSELKPTEEETTSPSQEAPDASGGDRPRDDSLGQPGGGKPRPSGSRTRKPKGERNPEVLATQPATDVAPTEGAGDRGEDGVRPGSEAKPGQETVPPSGDAADGRGGTGDEGLADAGSGDGTGAVIPAAVRPNFHIDDPERLVGGTPKVRFARNKAAIETMAALDEEQRPPTQEELETVAGYIGWGSFGQDLFQGTFERPYPRPGWDAESQWLRDHLGKENWESAQRSIINAHYTDPPTVQAMWHMVRQMGFNGGRVLEPSMGIGNFFGMMPRDIMANSTLTGIELDNVTGQMAKMLYPDAGVFIKGYQDSKTPDDFYDLVIGNWPFAAQSPPDRRYDKLSPTLHNYFFLKALDQTRPGGLVVGITSSGTMDSAGRAARIEMAKKGELIAAFRLPSGAFEKYAGTSVVTDIIILRKRAGPPEDVMAEPWVNASDMDTPAGQKIRVNEYFQSRPNNVLGTLDFGHGTTQGRAGMIVHRPTDLMERLQGLAARLPEDGYHPKIRGGEPRFITNSTADRQNAITVGPDGKLYQVAGERLMLLDDTFKGMKSGTAKIQANREAQVRSLVTMRKQYGTLIDAERDGLTSAEVFRDRLREQYEAFTKAHGRIVNSLGATVMRRVKDPSLPILESLELPDGTPARILREPVVRSRKSLENPSVSDAYVMVRNESANLDMDRVAELAKQPRATVEAQLLANGAVFRTPGGGFEPSDGYLSGNVRRKLREAQDAVERGEDMEASVQALTKALPPTVPYYQIEPKFGATWIGDEFYKQFIGDLLGLKGSDTDQIHVRFAGGRWKVTFDNDRLNRTPEATSTHGHPRYRFDKLLRAAMGNTSPRIFDPRDRDGGPYFNQKATEEVALKIQGVREKFQDWAWQDPERKIQLEGAFNEVMNAIAKPHFDGSFMDMSGMALRRGDDPFSLRRHQINAIWRGVNLGRGLFAHEVGTGKTYTIAGIAIEGRRYGKFNKPLIFAHNANSAAVAREMQEMYPGAKILYLDNLSPETIAASMYRIANEDWDAVVMPHSLIDRMALTRETLMELAQEEITALENEAMEAAREDNVKLTPEMMDDPEQMKKVRSVTAKQLVKQREAIIANIEKQANRASREGAVPFEKLGVDAIFVDEAHEFKKPPIATQMKVKGLNTATSDRSIALKFLTGYVKKNNSGNGVYLFTGTPVTNALNEIFNMSRYFMDDTMGRDGIADWDAWFNTFADATPDLELTAAGEYDSVTRLSSFVNVDELVRLMSQYTDVVQAKDMPEFVDRATDSGKTLGSPDLTEKERDFLESGHTDKPIGRPYKRVINDVGEITPDQRTILDTLQEQSRYFKQAPAKERREMMLEGDERVPIQVETNAANASLDARMYNPEAEDDPNNKINRVTKNALEVYGQPSAAQMIFVDRGYNGGKKNPNFAVIDELVRKLVVGGIPRNEIAIVAGNVTAQKKKEIADKMNSGAIRVMIGQSGTMGVGVNAQTNLRAMHHMDAPWRPGDLEQRNGRGHRQGNRWNTVLEYRYITEGIDGRRWQVLTSKDRFIKQFINAFNDESGKRIGTIEGDAADISENEDIMNTLSAAAGDPRLMQKEKYKADINRLERRERVHTQGVAEAASRAKSERGAIQGTIKRAASYAEAVGAWDEAQARMEEAAKAAGDKHRWYDAKIDGKELHSSEEIQDAFDKVVMGMVRGEKDIHVGTINGVQIKADWRRAWDANPDYSIAGADGEDLASLTGLTMPRILGTMRGLREDVERLPQSLAQREAMIGRLEEASKAKFAQADQLAMKRQQMAKLEDDLQANPIPPPAWLRHGAAIDSPVWVDGEQRIVRGHRMSDDYYLVTDEGDVPYLDAADENGSRLFEVHPAPTPPPAPPASPQGQATD